MSTRNVIQVEDLHKHYRLGAVGATQLGDDLRAFGARLRGRPDPRRPLDEQGRGISNAKDFWALRGVSFQVQEGETVGFVGRNGAGKSTLLKLLSRISLPTRGTIRMKGRVSSLLEVGTGFHPELSGRENIFLNGAIMGMRHSEVAARLDEIISFSGIEHHIDTPIKRYSSGMKVRLGFAVAAHLEPEILIVDEVLAVGDAEFQRKCMGKMRDASLNEGRTVLFVSHNMVAVQKLCPRTVWLDQGLVRLDGATERVVSSYLNEFSAQVHEQTWPTAEAPGTDQFKLVGVRAVSPNADGSFAMPDPVRLEFDVLNIDIRDSGLNLRIGVRTDTDEVAFISDMEEAMGASIPPLGRSRFVCTIPGHLLNSGVYRVELSFKRQGREYVRLENAVCFEVQEGDRTSGWMAHWGGVVRPRLEWARNVVDHEGVMKDDLQDGRSLTSK